MDEGRSQVGKAWCSPHDCPPSDCFQRHVAERETRQSFLPEMVPPGSHSAEQNGAGEAATPFSGLQSCEHWPKTRHFEIGGKSYFWCEGCNPFKEFGRG